MPVCRCNRRFIFGALGRARSFLAAFQARRGHFVYSACRVHARFAADDAGDSLGTATISGRRLHRAASPGPSMRARATALFVRSRLRLIIARSGSCGHDARPRIIEHTAAT